jgi:hypothetical protein
MVFMFSIVAQLTCTLLLSCIQQQQSAEATVLLVAAQEKKAREAKAQADAAKAQKARDAAAAKLKAERAATAIAAAAALAKREAQVRQPFLSLHSAAYKRLQLPLLLLVFQATTNTAALVRY